MLFLFQLAGLRKSPIMCLLNLCLTFNKVFNLKKSSKVEVVTAFLGLLELSRMSRIEVKQDSLFGEISVTKLKKEKI